MIIFNKNNYKSNLARSVKRFKDHDFLYQEVSQNISDRISDISQDFDDILEIGSRAILYKLINIKNRNYFHHNIEPQFIPLNSQSLISDNELLTLKICSFDLILSVLELHYTNDLPGIFLQILKLLKNNGLMIVAIFGGKTLYELRRSMIEAEIALNIPNTPRISPMADMQDITRIIQMIGFKNIIVDSYVITISYANIINLMHDLRYMGQGNILTIKSNKNITKNQLAKIAEIYQSNYSNAEGLIASFEIITITGRSNFVD